MGGKFSKVLDFDTVSLESKKCDKCYENSEIKIYLDDLKKAYKDTDDLARIFNKENVTN